jgi:acid phosphatase type 7
MLFPMSSQRSTLARLLAALMASTMLLAIAGCPKRQTRQISPGELKLDVKTPFRFVAYGDARFHDPKDFEVSNPPVRLALAKAIGDANPAFICFTGDLVYNGYDGNDWKVWDDETSVWREKKIPVYPAIGNHELHGDPAVALGNYFKRFPDLKESRYYSVRSANTLILALDSSLDETGGVQGLWLNDKLDHVPSDVDFVFLMLHHPPYTSSSEARSLGDGHAARSAERALARMLEQRQAHATFRIVVFSGHVHNYERHEHGGVTYFVSGGGAARAYPIERAPDDLFRSNQVNYHYLLVEVDRQQLKVTMNRLDLTSGKAVWTQPDSVIIPVPAPAVQSVGH